MTNLCIQHYFPSQLWHRDWARNLHSLWIKVIKLSSFQWPWISVISYANGRSWPWNSTVSTIWLLSIIQIIIEHPLSERRCSRCSVLVNTKQNRRVSYPQGILIQQRKVNLPRNAYNMRKNIFNTNEEIQQFKIVHGRETNK